jgi:hypothetical protein
MTDAPAARPAWKSFALWALLLSLVALLLFAAALSAGIAVATTSTADYAGLAVITYPLLASPPAGVLVLAAWVLIVLSFRRHEAERLQTFRFAALGISIAMTLVVGFLLFAWLATA